ncbi:vacuolar membrane-associated protein IML1 [Zymoseptoria brevis]|uniref:Vacuolar membrane-associated protein IML1 n=1 Tax=Zymoseptoria brevis TaxID=1047168 RepID=A0A0F4G574_9PEZI|nr:vacuolar membrane-associated protein IML1 [Zymoseptoria brevis]
MASDGTEKSCTVVLHDDRVSPVDILAGQRVMHVGEVAWLSASGAKTLCICAAGTATNSNEISIHISLAQRFGFENRVTGRVQLIDDLDGATATHAELMFRDQYLSRADMWHLLGRVQDTVLYRGQVLNYLGNATAEVKHIYISGNEVESGFCSHPQTKAIFRSASARYTMLVEISQEMLSSWNNGELMYERLLNGFLPDLFSRWKTLKVRHQVSVILFGRSKVANGNGKHDSYESGHGEDFFHVLVSEIVSSNWPLIIRKLKQAFNDRTLSRAVSLAAESNMLEAIHLTALDFSDDQTDTHLMSTGTSIIAVTAGTGLFDADHTLLKQTTDLLIGNSIGVDIVALSPRPLTPVPLFKYDHNGTTEYGLPHWVDISFWKGPYDTDISTWTIPETEEPVDDIALPFLKDSSSSALDISSLDAQDNQVFRNEANSLPKDSLRSVMFSVPEDSVGSADTMRGPLKNDEQYKTHLPRDVVPVDIPNAKSSVAGPNEPLNRAKRQILPLHPLLQSGRKISVGPKGLAPSRAVASTTVSSEHALHERDFTIGPSLPINDASNGSGIAKAIRASLARKPSYASLASHQISDPGDNSSSRPIDIQPISSHENTDLASIVEQQIAGTMVGGALEGDVSLSATPKAGNEMRDRRKRGSINESLDMLSPWVMLLNPCNPRKDNMRLDSQYRKWQHVFPRPVTPGSFKWASMCSPAALPLTAEYKPSASELKAHYRAVVRRHVISNSSGLRHETARNLIERLIDVRLIRGFQIVAIRNSGGDQTFQSTDRPILMALGRRYHELQRFSDFEVQIVQYEPKAGIGSEDGDAQHYTTHYKPKMRMLTGVALKSEVTYHSDPPLSDWSALDEHILGLAPLPNIKASFKVRLVLVPNDQARHDQLAATRLGGLSDDERRIEGIQRLTQTWQRQKYVTAEDQQHHVSLTKVRTEAHPAERDPNPLAIEYHTKDPSIVVNAHGPILSSQLDDGEVNTPLFADSEKHHSSNFDLSKLIKQMQELPPYGVEMRDRRWLTLTHIKCFRGDEMTTWLLGAFKDLKLRDDAVAVGNELMSRGVFAHVRQKHKFRDGHYFYQISGAYRTTEYPDTHSLFSKAPWRSAPAPIGEGISSPNIRPVSGISGDSGSTASSRGTPVTGPVDAKEIMLSQVMQYNVDPQKKSDHLQIVDLHYDRIHNPENCYHIQLEWLGTSTKLVRDAISRWSGAVESYGLRLVQVPLEEASKFREHHPFDQPQPISLAITPPDKFLATPLIEPTTFTPRIVEDRHWYHKALLRKRDFVLDFEAASAFSSALHVRHSWGTPNFAHTQFVHKSGLVLAQVLSDDTGDFLLLPNRLASSRLTGSSANTKQTPENAETVESIVKGFKTFCHDEEALRSFYSEADKPKPAAAPSPFTHAALAADLDVPPISLPVISMPHDTPQQSARGMGVRGIV